MATFQVTGPGGAVYQVQGPDGADPQAVLASVAGGQAPAQENPSSAPPTQAPVQGASMPPSSGGWLRDLGLGARDVLEGAVGAFTGPHDADAQVVNLVRSALNRATGTNLWRPYPLWQPGFGSALSAVGIPSARTENEKLAGSVVKGATGALTGAGMLGAVGDGGSLLARLPNLIRAGLAGAGGGAGQAVAQSAGAGPVGQLAAGLVGAAVPGALEGTASTVGSLVRPFLRRGQQQIAANVLADNATNAPAAAAALQLARPLVPGSMRTAGEASGDPGLLNLEKGVRAINPKSFAERISQQNAARQAELTRLGGTEADIAAAERERDAETAPMRENAFASAKRSQSPGQTLTRNSAILDSDGTPFQAQVAAPSSGTQVETAPVHQAIDDILASPAGAREAIGKTLRWAKGLLGEHSDPETLYEVRKDLELAQRGKLQPTGRDAPNESMLAQTRGQLGTVIGSLDDAIEKAAPGYKDYLARYRELSEPINQREAIQALQAKASSGLDPATQLPNLNGPSFARQLANTLEREGRTSNPLRFTPEQRSSLSNLREDLQRANAISGPGLRAPGSDTFQNFMRGNRLTGLAFRGARMIPGIGHIAQGLGNFVDQRVNQELNEAMLDPERAARLLRRGVRTLPLRAALGRVLQGQLPGTLGPMSALSGPKALGIPTLALPAPVPAAAAHQNPAAWARNVLNPGSGAMRVGEPGGLRVMIAPPRYPGNTTKRLQGVLAMK